MPSARERDKSCVREDARQFASLLEGYDLRSASETMHNGIPSRQNYRTSSRVPWNTIVGILMSGATLRESNLSSTKRSGRGTKAKKCRHMSGIDVNGDNRTHLAHSRSRSAATWSATEVPIDWPNKHTRSRRTFKPRGETRCSTIRRAVQTIPFSDGSPSISAYPGYSMARKPRPCRCCNARPIASPTWPIWSALPCQKAKVQASGLAGGNQQPTNVSGTPSGLPSPETSTLTSSPWRTGIGFKAGRGKISARWNHQSAATSATKRTSASIKPARCVNIGARLKTDTSKQHPE